MLEHRFKGNPLWSRLIRNISRHALDYLADEAIEQLMSVRINPGVVV